jgi:hypothetical protein
VNKPVIRMGTCRACGERRKCRKTDDGTFKPFLHTWAGRRCPGWLRPARDVSPEPEDLMIDPAFQDHMNKLIGG